MLVFLRHNLYIKKYARFHLFFSVNLLLVTEGFKINTLHRDYIRSLLYGAARQIPLTENLFITLGYILNDIIDGALIVFIQRNTGGKAPFPVRHIEYGATCIVPALETVLAKGRSYFYITQNTEAMKVNSRFFFSGFLFMVFRDTDIAEVFAAGGIGKEITDFSINLVIVIAVYEFTVQGPSEHIFKTITESNVPDLAFCSTLGFFQTAGRVLCLTFRGNIIGTFLPVLTK